MWEKMFDNRDYDQLHIKLKSSVALTVFAVGRCVCLFELQECQIILTVPGFILSKTLMRFRSHSKDIWTST